MAVRGAVLIRRRFSHNRAPTQQWQQPVSRRGMVALATLSGPLLLFRRAVTSLHGLSACSLLREAHPRFARPEYADTRADEFNEHPSVLHAKVDVLCDLLRRSRHTVALVGKKKQCISQPFSD